MKRIYNALFIHCLLALTPALLTAPRLHAEDTTRVQAHIMVLSLTSDGVFTDVSRRTGTWDMVPSTTEEALQAALSETEEARRTHRAGKIAAWAVDGEGRAIYRRVVDGVPAYEIGQYGGLQELGKTAFILAVPIEARRVIVQGWKADSRATFELERMKALNTSFAHVPEDIVPPYYRMPNRINMFIMGEGYQNTAVDKSKFQQDVNNFEHAFFATPPYSRYQSFFSVRSVMVFSVDRGAEHPLCPDTREQDPAMPTPPLNTAFSIAYCYQGIQRSLYPKDWGIFLTQVGERVGFDPDVTVILVNDGYENVAGTNKVRFLSGGSGVSKYAILSTGPDTAARGLHELGHSLLNLGDEYAETTYGNPFACNDASGSTNPCDDNITNLTQPPVKWQRWVNTSPMTVCTSGQTCQNTSSTDIGLFELMGNQNGQTQTVGRYRSEQDCAMRSYGNTKLCHVCKELAVEKFYEKVNPFDRVEQEPWTAYPNHPPSSQPMLVGAPITFGATMLPLGNEPAANPPDDYDVTWKVNGQEVAGQYDWSAFTLKPAKPGLYLVQLITRDPTTMIKRSAPHGGNLLYQPGKTITWIVPVAAQSSATSHGKTPALATNTYHVAQGTNTITVAWEIATEENGKQYGDTYHITVGYAPRTASGSVSSLALQEFPIDIEGVASSQDNNGKHTQTFSVLPAAVDADLVLTVSVQDSTDDDTLHTTVTANLVGLSPLCQSDCDACMLDPSAAACHPEVPQPTAVFVPYSKGTFGDSSYTSMGGLDDPRQILITLPTPSTVKFIGFQVWAEDGNGRTLGETNSAGVTPKPNQDTYAIGATVRRGLAFPQNIPDSLRTHVIQFHIWVYLTMTDGTIINRNVVVDHVVSGVNPADTNLVSRPLHALWFEPESKQEWWHWASLATVNWMKDNHALFVKPWTFADENAASDTPDGHQFGTAFNDKNLIDPHRLETRRAAENPNDHNDRQYVIDKIKAARQYLQPLLANDAIGQVRIPTGLPCGAILGSQDVEYLPGNWFQDLLFTGKVTNVHGTYTLDLTADIGTWQPPNVFKLVFLCGSDWNPDIYLDRCRIGEYPAPCTGRTILKHTHITSPPAATAISPGQSATLTVAAIGDELHYRWYSGNSGDVSHPIAGFDSTTLTVTPDSSQPYWVYVWGAGGADQSPAAMVTVLGTEECARPAITTQPITERIIVAGTAATLGVVVTGTALRYQWYRADWIDAPPTAIGGATYSTYNASSPGLYFVRVSNGCGSIDSNYTAILMGTTCVPAGVVGTTPPDNTMITAGSSLQLSVAAQGVEPISYLWYEQRPGGEFLPISTEQAPVVTPINGTSYAVHVMNECGGSTSQPFSINVCSPPVITAQPVAPNFYAPNQNEPVSITATGTNLHYAWYVAGAIQSNDSPSLLLNAPLTAIGVVCVVSNECGTVTSTEVIVPPACLPASITTQPLSAAINLGQNTTLSIDPAGYPTPTVKWFNVSGTQVGSGISLTISPGTTTTYYATVTNLCNSVQSVDATVTVNCIPAAITTQPQSFILSPGNNVLAVTAAGSLPHYQWYRGNSGNVSTPVGGDSRTYTVTDNATTNFWVRVTAACGSAADSNTATVSACPQITQQPAAAGPVMPGGTTTITLAASGNLLHYQWYQGAYGDTSHPAGGDSATLTTPAITQATTFWAIVSSGTCSVSSDTVTVGLCSISAIWAAYNNQVRTGQMQTITVIPVDGAMAAFYRGTSGNVAGSTLLQAASSSFGLPISPTATMSYWARVTDPATGCYADTQTLTITVCVPQITTQPQSQTITSGAQAHLSVATDIAGSTYQWYSGTSTLLTGQTAATLDVAPAVDTTYWVRVTGTCTTYANSQTAMVTVCNPPVINNGPQYQVNVNAGGSADLSVAAVGTGLSYQWYAGPTGTTTTPIGSSSNTLHVTPASTTSYWVKVNGTCGTANSPTSTVSVCPSVSQQPAAAQNNLHPGSSTMVSVTANASPISYQWYAGPKGTTTTPLGTNSNVLNTGALNATTTYWAAITSGSCTIQSEQVTVGVCNLSVGWANGVTQVRSGYNQTLNVSAPAGSAITYYSGTSGNVAGSTVVLGPTMNQGVPIAPTVTTSYWARVTDPNTGCYGDTSTITINVCIPTITTQPQSQTILSGLPATLSVAANGGTLTYQWYTGTSGTTTAPITGQTGTSLTVTPSATTSYWVRVTGACSTADSQTATVTICQGPVITTQPTSPPGVYPGYSNATSVTATGTGLTYQWYAGDSGNTSQPVSGATSRTLTLTLYNTEKYWVRVNATCGTPANSNTIYMSVRPTIVSNPVSVNVNPGSTAAFSVTASGTYMHYQWYLNDLSHPVGTDAPSYSTSSLNTNASYACMVTSGTAQTPSNWADVAMCSGPQISAPSLQVAGSCKTIAITVTDDGSHMQVQWFLGARGDTSHPATNLGDLQSTYVYFQSCATGTRSYWARFTNADTNCYTDSAATTVN